MVGGLAGAASWTTVGLLRGNTLTAVAPGAAGWFFSWAVVALWLRRHPPASRDRRPREENMPLHRAGDPE